MPLRFRVSRRGCSGEFEALSSVPNPETFFGVDAPRGCEESRCLRLRLDGIAVLNQPASTTSVGEALIDGVCAIGKELHQFKISHINTTASGGGLAELLSHRQIDQQMAEYERQVREQLGQLGIRRSAPDLRRSHPRLAHIMASEHEKRIHVRDLS